eukprot:scaffold137664_cov27-Tisochrysis_lutea.AAC.2
MGPGYDISAAAALSCFHVFALQVWRLLEPSVARLEPFSLLIARSRLHSPVAPPRLAALLTSAGVKALSSTRSLRRGNNG